MQKSLKNLPIPQEMIEKLTDKNLSKLERIELAEQVRAEYRQSRNEMMLLTGIANTEYSRGQRILRAGNTELIEQLRKSNGSLREAVRKLSIPNYGQYLLRANVTDEEEIVYEDARTFLYKKNGEAYLRICRKSRGKTSWNIQERVYTIDNKPYGVDVALGLLKNGYKIHPDLRVCKENKFYATLKHYVVASYADVPVEKIANEKISFKNSRVGKDRTDIRIENLKCDEIPFMKKDFSINMKSNELVIICSKNRTVYYTDRDCALYDLLNDSQTKFHLKGRDERLAVQLPNGAYEYLYHLVMAESLYGHPATKDGFVQIMADFRSNYVETGIEVDHLDGDVTNNRTENLILMDGADNKRKCALFQKIKLPYFCLLEKHDNSLVKIQCGSYAATKKPMYFVDKILPIKEALSELQGFIEQIHFEHVVTSDDNKKMEEMK